jgi:hypothetical protein
MPGKLRKNRSKSVNRPVSKQSRKTPKRNVSKSKARKTTRRRVKRGDNLNINKSKQTKSGGASAASGCDMFTKEFIEKEENGIFLYQDSNGSQEYAYLNIPAFRKILAERKCNYNEESQKFIEEQILAILNKKVETVWRYLTYELCVKSVDDLKNDIIRMLFNNHTEITEDPNYTLVKDLENDSMFNAIYAITNLKYNDKQRQLNELKSTGKDKETNPAFIENGLKLLFTVYGAEGKISVSDKEKQQTIKNILIAHLKKEIFKIVDTTVDTLKQYNKKTFHEDEFFNNLIRLLNQYLTEITGYWFLDFCRYQKKFKTGDITFPSRKFYAEKILQLHLDKNGITIDV